MKYLALLDFQHLENNMFMKAFAQAVSRQNKVQGIIVHGESPYTDRLIQTGMMREDARIRSTKELNTRIVTLLADSGVSAIGMNPYQRNSIILDPLTNDLMVNTGFFQSLPNSTYLILSNLIGIKSTNEPRNYPVVPLLTQLKKALKCDEIFAFSSNEKDEIFASQTPTASIKWEKLDEHYKNNYFPGEVIENPISFRLTTTKVFGQVPDLSGSKEILYKGSRI